jgi:hypothetical protein
MAFVFIILSLLMIPNLASAGNQGLHWAVSVGETRQFSLLRDWNSSMSGYAYTNEVVTLEVTENPEIPDNITALTSTYYDPWVGLPHIERVGYWENGSDMGMQAYIFPSPVLLPIGNWTLIVSLFEDYLLGFSEDYDTEVVENSHSIGYRWSLIDFEITDFREVWWSKSDGMFMHYHRVDYDMQNEVVQTDGEVVIDVVSQSLPWDAILLIGVPAGVVLLIGAVLVSRRRT